REGHGRRRDPHFDVRDARRGLPPVGRPVRPARRARVHRLRGLLHRRRGRVPVARALAEEMKRGLALLLLGLAISARADIFLVRHADKKTPDEQSLLSAKGHKRAKDLARTLSSVKLKAVYRTEFERTGQTAAPTAAAQGLTPIEVKSDDVKGLAKTLRALPAGENVLVVG